MENFEIHNTRINCKSLNKLLSLLDPYLYEETPLYEGIKISKTKHTVFLTDDNEDLVDTSIENKPVIDNINCVYNGENISITTYSIFKRLKDVRKYDATPLLYAIKNMFSDKKENEWHFPSEEEQRIILNRIKEIAEHINTKLESDIFVLIPSHTGLNEYIANLFKEINPDITILSDVVLKRTVEEVEDIILNKDSYFNYIYDTDRKFNEAWNILNIAFNKMDDEYDGLFISHLIPDQDIRNTIIDTMKLNKEKYVFYSKDIDGNNIVLIDDTITGGRSIKECYQKIMAMYKPKSVSVLTLFSKLYNS